MSQQSALSRNRIVSALVLLSLLAALVYVRPASADPGFLLWTAIDTPSTLNNVIVTPSEINAISIGSDDRTFYAVDIPDGILYKSEDGGITWPNALSVTGATTPVWNIAVAPDDVNFIVAITTGGTPSGPKEVYISTDGGTTWQNTNFTADDPTNEFISCVDVSVSYGGTNRDIAVGTRTGAAAGHVYVMESTGFSSWNIQNPPPPTPPVPAFDVVALKFSPTYPSDNGLVVVSSDASGTRLHLGARDIASNLTNLWDGAVAVGFPVELRDSTYPPANPSPNASEIITADLELPSDFSAQTSALRRFYISDDSTTANRQVGIYRVDDSVPHLINSAIATRISSIAYYGTYASGSLLAGEVTADPALGLVNIWRAVNCTALAPAWLTSDTYKSPTGGGTSGYANAQLAWSPDGTRAYCGTSSDNLSVGGTSTALDGRWPMALTIGQPLDESAFSVSPYGPAYAQILTLYGQSEDTADIGNIWNQLSLIDTEMDFLSDVAVLEAPEGSNDYDILYVFSISENTTVPTAFDSLWRSISDPLGGAWERVLCTDTNDDTILRVKQTTYEETGRSLAIVFAEVGSDMVGTSQDEGQTWNIGHLTTVTDLALSSDTLIYVLNDTVVYRYTYTGSNWTYDRQTDTQLAAGHTIAVPLKNPEDKDMVLVGEKGTIGYGRIAYLDFSKTPTEVEPDIAHRIAPPVTGDAHVIFDDRFEENGIIYNAIHDPAPGNGRIYRWIVGKSTAWTELEPPNTDFYGLAQRNDVLYSAWRYPQVAELTANEAGVDRTIYPRVHVPPPPEWDYLVAGLPVASPAINFTREPSSLKITSNQYVSLWAIDNHDYDFANNIGRLWEYTDNLAKLGPFTTTPPSGSDIPVDPKTGRAEEVNFGWRQISYSTVYELQVAKDADFHTRVLVNENITPADQLSPVVYTPAGALIPASGSNIGSWANLESGHTYYWRVRARAAITGEQVRSPWSATMYFTVEAGLPTASPYPSVTLFNPTYGSINVSNTPAFSWSGMPKTTTYEFVLAADAALQQVVVKADVPTTSYLYDGKLNYNTTYFWQVRALEPVVSDPSPVGIFTVMAAPKPVTPEVETPAPIPSWVWWIIAVITALIAAIIAYAMVKPGYSRPAAGGKLFKVEPVAEKPKEAILDKPRNRFLKIWDSVVMAVKRRRFLRKRTDKEPSDSQDNLT
jgi:hypothetical protein